jgi:hypothetical protein
MADLPTMALPEVGEGGVGAEMTPQAFVSRRPALRTPGRGL